MVVVLNHPMYRVLTIDQNWIIGDNNKWPNCLKVSQCNRGHVHMQVFFVGNCSVLYAPFVLKQPQCEYLSEISTISD